MELLRATAPEVKFTLPTNNTAGVEATCSYGTGDPKTLSVTVTGGVAKARLPYLHVEGTGQVDWVFTIPGSGTFTEKVPFEVVTPYIGLDELKDMGVPADKAKDVEAAVRHIINAHTGQSFGFKPDRTITVEGHGDSAVRLPERLIELKGLSTMTSVLDHRAAIVVSDGWYLKKSWAHVTGPLDNDSLYWGEYSGGTPFDNNIYGDPDGDGEGPFVGPLGSRPGGVIVAPNAGGRATPWKDDYPFAIHGDWGYKQVPEPVKEAAKLLANDFACNEQLYRDRYLESIKAADWRLQFNSRAWDNTGNARADHLLSEYVLLDWLVI